MRPGRIAVVLIGAAALLGACKDPPAKPATGTSASSNGGGDGEADHAAPERHVGPSGGRMRPRRNNPGSPDVRAPDDSGGDGDGERRDWRGGDRGDRPSRQDRIAEFDSNGDGDLDDAERAAMKQSRLEERMSRMDQDGDGKLAPAEIESNRRFGAIDFTTADTDHDGFLSTGELDVAMEAIREQRGPRGDDERRRSRDGDGGQP